MIIILQCGGIGLYSNSDFGFYTTKIYNSGWKIAIPYIYNGTSWVKIGAAGTLMIPFYDANGQKVYDSNSQAFLVRKT